MTEPRVKLLAVVGSLRERSVTRAAVLHALARAKELGAATDVVDLRETRLPVFDPDHRQSPELQQVLPKMNWANAFLLGTPDYHGGMSGAMKNFLDYFWREMAGKLFGYVCASHEKGLTVMEQMRTAIRQCYGWSLPYGVSLSDEDWDPATRAIKSPRVAHRLNLLAHDLVAYAPLIRGQFEADLHGNNAEAGFAAHFRLKK